MRDFIAGPDFALSAPAVIRSYGDLGDADASIALHRDLASHVASDDPDTFVAIFPDAIPASGREFDRALRSQLDHLARLDHLDSGTVAPWSAIDAADMDAKAFSIRIASHPLTVTGLHPASRHPARRAPCEALVFTLDGK